LRLAAVAAPLPLLLAVTLGASAVPAQAASTTGLSSAGRAPAPGIAPAAACASPAGTGWKQVATPNPGNFDELNGVAVLSSCQAWAVGNYSGGTLIESWDGTAWTQQPSPSPGSAGNGLFAVAATSATDAWAVGDYSTTADPAHTQALIEHWDGTAWKQVPTPNPTANDALSGVAAISATDAWAVGEYVTGAGIRTLIEHWDGTAWKQVPSPSPGGTNGSTLSSVDATSATSAWAVGNYFSSGTVDKTLIEHWNGTTWTRVPSPSPGGSNGSALSGVDAASAASAWAVGSYSNMDKTLILHWNGTTWSRVASPNPSPFSNELSGVAAASPADIWAVGIHSVELNFLTLALHCC